MKKHAFMEGHWVILVIMVIVSLGGIFVGISSENNAIITVAGAFLGATIGSAVAKYDGVFFQEKTLDVIRATLNSKFISDEKELSDNVKQEWHVYYATKSNDKNEWRYVTWDFRKQPGLGVLSGSYITYDKEGNEHTYDIEAGMRDTQLIAIDKAPDSMETCSVVVMPTIGQYNLLEHFGIKFFQTWEAKSAVGSIIMSKNQLKFTETVGVGPITDENIMQKLKEKWIKGFYNTHIKLI